MSNKPIYDGSGKEIGQVNSSGFSGGNAPTGPVYDSSGSQIGFFEGSGGGSGGIEGILAFFVIVYVVICALIVVGIPLAIGLWFYKANKYAALWIAMTLTFVFGYYIIAPSIIAPYEVRSTCYTDQSLVDAGFKRESWFCYEHVPRLIPLDVWDSIESTYYFGGVGLLIGWIVLSGLLMQDRLDHPNKPKDPPKIG